MCVTHSSLIVVSGSESRESSAEGRADFKVHEVEDEFGWHYSLESGAKVDK